MYIERVSVYKLDTVSINPSEAGECVSQAAQADRRLLYSSKFDTLWMTFHGVYVCRLFSKDVIR